MGDTTKTKAAMLNELESIKGLLLAADDIPILQEAVPEPHTPAPSLRTDTPNLRTDSRAQERAESRTEERTEEQQDFFRPHSVNPPSQGIAHPNSIDSHPPAFDHHKAADHQHATDHHLLNDPHHLNDHHKAAEHHKAIGSERPPLAKALGENPFLPEHIRARLHGNNPPPLFAAETADKITHSSSPSRQLGSRFNARGQQQQDIIDSIIAKMMPEIEQELRSRLALMSQTLLDELHK